MEAAAKPDVPSAPRRRGVVTALLIFTTFLAFVAMFSIWANRQEFQAAKTEVLGTGGEPGG